MASSETFLQEAQGGLSEVLRPYQQQLNQRQRMADFVQQCIRYAERDDFFRLDELLKSQMADDVEQEPELNACKEFFDRLQAYADEKVERYRIQFVEDLMTRAAEADLPMEVDFPRFTVLTGIEGSVDFSARCTIINKKTLKSIDPRRIVSAALNLKRQLYDRPFDPHAFIAGLYQTYSDILKREKKAPGHSVPMQQFYLEYVLSLQSKVFFQDMDKGKFRGYTADQFAVDIWRYFQAGIGGTVEGHTLQLRPGRNNALWLIDSDGERRQITAISFQERKK